MADWWDSISNGFSSVTDWLGGSGGKALTTGVGLVGAGMDIYSGIKNQNLADKYANLTFSTAEQQNKYSQELFDRQKSLYWPLENTQAQLTAQQLGLALDPTMWGNYYNTQLAGSELENMTANAQKNIFSTMLPGYYTQAQYASDRAQSDVNQQRSLDQTYYDTEKSVIRKLTEGEDVLRDRMMNQAQTDTNVAYAQSADELRAQLGLAGVSTSSQQAVNALTQLKQSEALAQAGAMTSAARTAEDTALSRQSQALNYGKGATLPSVQYTPQTSTTINALTGNTTSNAGSSAQSGMSSAGDMYGNLYNSANNAAQQNWTGLGYTFQNLTKQYIN